MTSIMNTEATGVGWNISTYDVMGLRNGVGPFNGCRKWCMKERYGWGVVVRDAVLIAVTESDGVARVPLEGRIQEQNILEKTILSLVTCTRAKNILILWSHLPLGVHRSSGTAVRE